VSALPEFLHEPFAAAMSQSLLLPAFAALFGIVAAIFLVGFRDAPTARRAAPPVRSDVADHTPDEGLSEEDIPDDDEYLEYTIAWDDPSDTDAPVDSVTEPLTAVAPEQAPAPQADDPWRRVLDELLPELPPRTDPEPNAFTHNGFDAEQPDAAPGRHARP
jgi:hypothetical protein